MVEAALLTLADIECRAIGRDITGIVNVPPIPEWPWSWPRQQDVAAVIQRTAVFCNKGRRALNRGANGGGVIQLRPCTGFDQRTVISVCVAIDHTGYRATARQCQCCTVCNGGRGTAGGVHTGRPVAADVHLTATADLGGGTCTGGVHRRGILPLAAT